MSEEETIEAPTHGMFELKGVDGESKLVGAGADLDELYARRDQLNATWLATGRTLTEKRFAVRPLGRQLPY